MRNEHDVIWLTDELGDEGRSWCEDSQNERDIKYLLATPAREKAQELLKVLNDVQLHLIVGSSIRADSDLVDRIAGVIEMAELAA